MSAVDEIKKAKELLDSGTITEEEFSKIKTRLLNGNKENSDPKPAPKKAAASKKPVVKAQQTSASKKSTVNKPTASNSTTKKQKQKSSPWRGVFIVLFLVGLLGYGLSYSLHDDPVGSAILAFFTGMGAIIWCLWKIGRRTGFFFFAPYMLFTVSFIIFTLGLAEPGVSLAEDEVSRFLLWFFSIVEIIALLIEFFAFQPKCSNCGKRLGMRYQWASDYDSFDYVGTKTYKIRNRGGEKIGEYEGPVAKTHMSYTARYQCKHCDHYTSRRESETYESA